MTPEHWRAVLSTWSREILAVEAYRREFPIEVVESEWLGYPGATDEEITATEASLDITVPLPYHAFLTVTNGWRTTTTFIDRIRPVGEIAWYREAYPERLAGWLEGERISREEYDIPPEDWMTGDDLREALAISDYDDRVYLLIPRPSEPDGEWPAWFFAPWIPGEEEYGSFWELMVAQKESFLDLEQAERT
jgi:hypothetical protein